MVNLYGMDTLCKGSWKDYIPTENQKLVESAAHTLGSLSAPSFQPYLTVHNEVKTMFARWCWGAESPVNSPLGHAQSWHCRLLGKKDLGIVKNYLSFLKRQLASHSEERFLAH